MATATKPARKAAPRRAAAKSPQKSVETLVRSEIKIMSNAVSSMQKEFEKFLNEQRAAAKKSPARPRRRATRA